MSSQSGTPEEQPLDPALIRVQKRLRRLMIIGISSLGIGVAAVLVAIIYRFYIADTSDPRALIERTTITGEVTAEALGLAPDAELIEQTLDGDRMAYTFRDSAGLVTVIIDLTTMTVVRQFRVGAE
jgi:hypothetical protein